MVKIHWSINSVIIYNKASYREALLLKTTVKVPNLKHLTKIGTPPKMDEIGS